MENSLSIFVSLIMGLLIGACATWMIVRAKIQTVEAKVRGEVEVEAARLNERLLAAQNEIEKLTKENEEQEEQATVWRDQIDALRDERAQLTERSARLPELQKTIAEAETTNEQLKQTSADMREKLGAAESTVSSQSNQIAALTQEKEAITKSRDDLIADQQKLKSQIAELSTTLESERLQTGEKLDLLKKAEKQLSDRFKTLANEILDEKSKKFTDQNKTNLDLLLEPLKLKIGEFQNRVNEVYVQESKDRSALSEQVKQLMELNNKLSEDAHNLTTALKGQAKSQGNWGELILERVLEASGLRKGHEYDVQESHSREDGTRAQPDVVVHLPEDRHLIIDAKVSLNAYEEHVSAENDVDRDNALKRHLDSVRTHIRSLAEKNYQQLYGIQSLDFVMMFVPIEPAFMLAISHDSNLWQDAWKRNVLLVSPSTLLFVVRTVAHLWRQEQQNRNAQEIASRGGELYDKLVGFVEDLDRVGERINQAKDTYDKAYGKFTGGRGNVIRQAEMLKDLGVKPSKQLPQKLIELIELEDKESGLAVLTPQV